MSKRIVVVVLLLALLTTSIASAQQYAEPALSSYSVVNLDSVPQNIMVNYYDQNAVVKKTATFSQVPPGGSVTIQQATESGLPGGEFSAVLSSGGPLAAVVNQQLGQVGSGTSIPPFSSYTGASGGAKTVTLPEIMYNWYGYSTDIYVQNVGGGDAANIQIQYVPTSIGNCTTGATGQSDTVASSGNVLKVPASREWSLTDLAKLGAPSVSGCASFTGRFLGSATITSDQDIAVVVNQKVQNKLFTYNGFVTPGTNLTVPAYMRNWYNYYASLTIANPGATDATVQLQYIPGAGSNPTAPINATKTVPAGKSINIYDGPTGSGTDLAAAYPYNSNPPKRFFGSIKITSNQPVFAVVNQEATTAGGNQAGTYNVPTTGEGTKKITVPLIQSAFYGYYTSLTIASVDGTNPRVRITYTSDGNFSTVKNQTRSYEHDLAAGFLNRYEGSSATAAQADILDDPAWANAQGQRNFIGSAIIEVIGGSNANIVAFVNSESQTAPNAATRDSMYTFNAINLQ